MNGYESFIKTEIRVGKIIEVQDFPEAKKPAYKLTIDLGPAVGIKKSSAQIVSHYTKEQLINSLVMCLVNIESRQIGPFRSEVLTLGVPGPDNQCVLIRPDQNAIIGGRLY